MAEEQDNQEVQEQQDSSKSQGSGKNPLATLLLLINTVGLGVIGFVQYSAHQREANKPSIRDIVKVEMKSALKTIEDGDEGQTGKKRDPNDGILFPLDGFTANLAQGDGPRRYIRVNMIMKFSKDSQEEEFKSRKPQIRDTIITILNSKRPEDLLKKEGKSFLKEEIKAAVNSFLIDGHVKDIYYIGFQIN